MKPNPGHCPPEAYGKRIRGVLANDARFDGWPADGKGACRWSRAGQPHDIKHFEVIP